MHKAMMTCAAAAIIAMTVFAYARQAHKNKPSNNAQSTAFAGYVTDVKCRRNIDAVCNKQCFLDGAQPALLLDGTGDLLRLNNAEEVKKYPGVHVEIKGVRENDMLTVSAVTQK